MCQGAGCGNHPQACVDWCDAYAYCAAVGKRLCGRIGGGPNGFADYADATKSQWYNACTSGGANSYPYGDAYMGSSCNAVDLGIGATVEVGSLATCQSSVPGYTGVYDLSGNVAEWEDSCISSTGPGDDCQTRGGAFGSPGGAVDCAQVPNLDPHGTRRNSAYGVIGFRCCGFGAAPAEQCNFADDDGDGQVDEGFDWVVDPWKQFTTTLMKVDSVTLPNGRVVLLSGGTSGVNLWLLSATGQVLDGPLALSNPYPNTGGNYLAADASGGVGIAFAGTNYGVCPACRLRFGTVATSNDTLAVSIPVGDVQTTLSPVQRVGGLAWTAASGFVVLASAGSGGNGESGLIRINAAGTSEAAYLPLVFPSPHSADYNYGDVAATGAGVAWMATPDQSGVGTHVFVGLTDSSIASTLFGPLQVTQQPAAIDHDIRALAWLGGDIAVAYEDRATASWQPTAVLLHPDGSVKAGPKAVGPAGFGMAHATALGPGLLVLAQGAADPRQIVLHRLADSLDPVVSAQGGQVSLGSYSGTGNYLDMTVTPAGVLVTSSKLGVTLVHCP